MHRFLGLSPDSLENGRIDRLTDATHTGSDLSPPPVSTSSVSGKLQEKRRLLCKKVN